MAAVCTRGVHRARNAAVTAPETPPPGSRAIIAGRGRTGSSDEMNEREVVGDLASPPRHYERFTELLERGEAGALREALRGLHPAEVADWFESLPARALLGKELMVGAINGLAWAAVVAAIAALWFRDPWIGAVVAAALLLNTLVAALAGAALPLLLRRVSVDPALAGGVVLTTITDVVGFAAILGLGALALT